MNLVEVFLQNWINILQKGIMSGCSSGGLAIGVTWTLCLCVYLNAKSRRKRKYHIYIYSYMCSLYSLKNGYISIGCLTLSATCFKHVFPQPRRSRPRDDTWQHSEASYGGRIWALPQRTGSFWLKDGGEKGFSCWPRLNATPTRSFQQHTCIETWVMYGNALNTRMHLQKWGWFVPSTLWWTNIAMERSTIFNG